MKHNVYFILLAVVFTVTLAKSQHPGLWHTINDEPSNLEAEEHHHHHQHHQRNHSHTGFVAKITNSLTKITNSVETGVEKIQDQFRAIYPGTKWCGSGNRAKNESDLGKHREVDSCCRSHDKCPDSIDRGSTKYGLVNTGLFTRSSCQCDREFYDCLKAVRNGVSRRIGTTYFTILCTKCFQMVDCSASTCRDGKSYGHEYQWLDNPKF